MTDLAERRVVYAQVGRSPVVMFVAAMLALAGCSTSAGTPAAATATSGTVSVTTAPPVSSTAPQVRIEAPRKLDRVDPCTLLGPDDFVSVGPFAAKPRRYDDQIPNSCILQIGDGSRNDLVVTIALAGDYRQFQTENPEGYERVVGIGHSAWTTCGPAQDGSMVCAVAYAVATNRTLVVGMSLYNGNANQVVQIMHRYAEIALDRLPLA